MNSWVRPITEYYVALLREPPTIREYKDKEKRNNYMRRYMANLRAQRRKKVKVYKTTETRRVSALAYWRKNYSKRGIDT